MRLTAAAVGLLSGGVALAACGGPSSTNQPVPVATATPREVTPINTPFYAPTPGASPTPGTPFPAKTLPVETDGNAPGIPPLHGPIQSTPSGLRYIDQVVGTGSMPSPTSNVTVHYDGWLTDGTHLALPTSTLAFRIDQVIRGWTEGLSTMRVGGKRRLIIPASLAYGDKGFAPTIPPGATLIFDVELLGAQ